MPPETKKILIVEDEKPVAKALRLKLNQAGFETQEAGNGEEALAAIAKEKFDLILLDLVMPKMDGFAVLSTLKERNNQTPVVVTSNLSQEEDTRRAKEAGAKEFFVKSDVPIIEIVEHVKKMLNRS